MKKILYFLSAIILVAGCKKETSNGKQTVPSAAVTHALNFSISDFGLTTGNLTTNSIQATTTLKDQIKYLQYAVFEGSVKDYSMAEPLYRSQQHAGTEQNFGLIRDSLQDGRFSICFVGTNNLGVIQSQSPPVSGGATINRPTFLLDYKSLTSNMFYAFIDTTVAGKPLDKPVTMRRMVSKVTIHLSDAIPTNAAKFVLTFVDYPPGLDLASGSGLSRGRQDEYYPDASFEFPVTANYVGKKDIELCAIVFPYYYPQIALDCLDASGKVIARKILPKNFYDAYNKLDQNTQYKFTGYFFGHTANFNVTIDSKWNSPVNVPFSIPGSTQRQ